MTDLVFEISAISDNPGRVTVKAKNFSMIIDEPPSLGGTDQGPNPMEYLLASLAGCLNVVGHIVASEMKINIEKLSIEISGNLNPDKLFGKESNDRAGFKSINVVMNISTDADIEKLKKWVEEVEKRCPVTDNLRNPTKVNIEFRKTE
ncbi:MAG: hypothetical protein PWQ48_1708 [Thermotogaceae bacterium]|jgi:uncharacterized OsmC-like protein|nr:hypothetical protein [Thermotogaceae bacterium]